MYLTFFIVSYPKLALLGLAPVSGPESHKIEEDAESNSA
jgi:hypothetical protein